MALRDSIRSFLLNSMTSILSWMKYQHERLGKIEKQYRNLYEEEKLLAQLRREK